MNIRANINGLASRADWRSEKLRPAYPGPSEQRQGAGAGDSRPPAAPLTELERVRDDLRTRFADQQSDLGGLVYEMVRRDHFRLDVVTFQAARLQDLDAQLGEIERLCLIDAAAAGGECGSCSALHGREAQFCWRCGTRLMSIA